MEEVIEATSGQPQRDFGEALSRWREELASGRSWNEVEAEVLECCRGDLDILTRMLIEAETGSPGLPQVPSSQE